MTALTTPTLLNTPRTTTRETTAPQAVEVEYNGASARPTVVALTAFLLVTAACVIPFGIALFL